MATMIDTGKVHDFRVLRFASLDELEAEIARICAAERVGTLRHSGNWSAGQSFGHLATWINYAYDGYPADLRPPWFVKLILKLRKSKFMRGPLPRGVKIPGLKGGTKGTEPLSLDEGESQLRRAIGRLRSAPPTVPNVIFGPLSHEEWKSMHCRHAELHLGYLHPK